MKTDILSVAKDEIQNIDGEEDTNAESTRVGEAMGQDYSSGF